MPGGHARFDGTSFSIGCLNNSPPRMNVRNGWRMFHLPHLPATRSVNRRDGPEIYYVRGGSIFGKATKVAKNKIFRNPKKIQKVGKTRNFEFSKFLWLLEISEICLISLYVSFTNVKGNQPKWPIIGDSGQYQAEFISQDAQHHVRSIFFPDCLSSQDPMSLPSLEWAKPTESLV